MSRHILKLNFKPQLICQILEFKESCILADLEVFGPKLKAQIFPGHVAFT